MKFVILDPAAQSTSCPLPQDIFDGQDVAGKIVVEVADDFTWLDRAVDWATNNIVPDLSRVRADKLAALSARFDLEVSRGCDSPLGWVDCDDQARLRITGLLQWIATSIELGGDVPTSWPVTMFDDHEEEHSLLDLKALGVAIGIGWAAYFAVKQAHKAMILAAETIGELAAIDITAGWPS